MVYPIETKGMGKPESVYGEKRSSSGVCCLFHHPERTAHLCRRLWLQVLANRPAQIA
jgi:hypothetical protein